LAQLCSRWRISARSLSRRAWICSDGRLANEHWERLQEDFNNPRSPLAQILQEPDPSKVPQKLVQRGQIGGSPYNAQLLDRYRIDKAPVKWVISGDLFQKNFGLYNGGKSLGGYSDSFLQSIFTPQELSHLYKTGAIARSVGLNVNPSGTAGAMNAIEDVTHPRRAFFKAIPAAATNSPGFNQWMMNPAQQAPSLAARVGRGVGQKLNPRPQLQSIPLSNLLGPAVTGNRPEEDDIDAQIRASRRGEYY
jgi:hypothetical protein